MIKGLIFDMDGVIINSMDMHFRMWRKIFTEYGHEFTTEEFKSYNGMSTEDVAITLIEKYGWDTTPQSILKEKQELADKYRPEMITLFPDVHEVLAGLIEDGYKLALATSSRRSSVDFVKEKFGIEKYFKEIVFVDMVEHAKPDPAIFQLAGVKLNIPPEECAVMEDAINGITAAKAANMIGIGMATTFGKESFTHADYVVSSLTELRILLKKLKGSE